MRLEEQALPGVFLLVPEPSEDSRGFFARSFSAAQLADAGLETRFPEWSLSYNRLVGTLRGLHWQAEPHLEVKLVQCVQGTVFDVVVDARRGSPRFGHWQAFELSAANRNLLYIPAGFAHGFQTLTDNAELYYHISEPFCPEGARGVRWNDPELAIAWPDPASGMRIISDRDQGLPLLADATATR